MGFSPKNFNMCDNWQYSDGERVHDFFLQWRKQDDRTDAESGSIGHIVSSDLIHWQELPYALCKGQTEGCYDDIDIWTGCTVEKDGIIYLFYTSRTGLDPAASTISVATSTDLIHWEKHPENPIIKPDPRYYCNTENRIPLATHGNGSFRMVDCRDLCVVWDGERGHWWGYYAARRPAKECAQTSVIALLKSYDLIHWEHLPPCFCPDKYHCIETPEVFQMGEKWYMLCLSGNTYGQRAVTKDRHLTGRFTIYAVADNPEGPYTEIYDDNVLFGSPDISGFCARTVMHKEKRYLFYSQALYSPTDSVVSLSLPKELVALHDGRLALKMYDKIADCYGEKQLLCQQKLLENHGQWGSVCDWKLSGNEISVQPISDWTVQVFDYTADNFVLETVINAQNVRSAGIMFDIDGENIFCHNLLALLDFEADEVWLTKARSFPEISVKDYRFNNKQLELTLLVIDNTIEIYIDGYLVLYHQTERTPGKIGLFVERGNVAFENTVIHPIVK